MEKNFIPNMRPCSWRENNENIKQHTWIKVSDGRVSAALPDIHKRFRSRVSRSFISPCRLSNHLVVVDYVLSSIEEDSFYSRFKTKLL